MAKPPFIPIRDHVDCALLGNDPALLLTACLLARKGLRVRLFTEGITSFPWLAGGALLQRWCQQLNLTLPIQPQPLQIITSHTRLELSGERSLEEELQRELPGDAKDLIDWLQRLQRLGGQLHQLMERSSPPLGGWRHRLGFFFALCLHLPASISSRSAASSLPQQLSPEAQLTARTLLEGLALAPLARISTVEAALLLHAQLDGLEPDGQALTTLLRQRLQQFHGREESLSQIQEIARDGNQWRLLTDQGAFSVGRLMLGRMGTLPAGCPPLAWSLPQSWQVMPGQKLPAPMGQRLLLAGTPSLRLEVVRRDGPPLLQLSAPPMPAAPMMDPLARLTELLPFGDISVEVQSAAVPPRCRPGLLSRGPLPLHPAPGLAALHGPSLLPHLAGQADLLAVAALVNAKNGS